MLSGSTETTTILLENGADINVEDTGGKRPIHYAAAEDNEHLIVLFTKIGRKKAIPDWGHYLYHKYYKTPIQSRNLLVW